MLRTPCCIHEVYRDPEHGAFGQCSPDTLEPYILHPKTPTHMKVQVGGLRQFGVAGLSAAHARAPGVGILFGRVLID